MSVRWARNICSILSYYHEKLPPSRTLFGSSSFDEDHRELAWHFVEDARAQFTDTDIFWAGSTGPGERAQRSPISTQQIRGLCTPGRSEIRALRNCIFHVILVNAGDARGLAVTDRPQSRSMLSSRHSP